MTKEHAHHFLKQVSSDPQIAEQVTADYRKLLQDLAREKGLEFTEEELVEAAQALKDAAAGEVSDATLDMVVGGDIIMEPGLIEGQGWKESGGFLDGKGLPI